MKKDNINYFMVGLFVIGMLLLLFFMLYRITGQQAGAQKYFTVLNKVTAIHDGSVVTYGGYPIGKVADISPLVEQSKTRYRVELAIRGDWRIPDDSTAQIVTPGLIAGKQIEITEGVSTRYLEAGGRISGIEAVDMMSLVKTVSNELNTAIPDLAKEVSGLLQNLNHSAEQLALLLSDENRRHVSSMFANVDEASANLAGLAAGFERISGQLDRVLQSSNNILVSNDQDIRRSVMELREAMGTISTNIRAVMYNLESSSRNLNEFSRQLRDNPGVLIGGKAPADKAVLQP